MFRLLLLAEGQTPDPNSFWWVPLAVIGALFYFMLVRPERQKRANLTAMLDNLKKNDRVVTIGGIYGTVVNVQKGSEDITIKVDEGSNTRLRVLRSSISRVVTDSDRAPNKRDTE